LNVKKDQRTQFELTFVSYRERYR